MNSGVLVQDGVAYAAAGAIDYDGTYVYALDALTGKVIWQNTTSGHLSPTSRKGVSAQGGLTIADGKLWLAGGNMIGAGVYDLRTGECFSVAPKDTDRSGTHRGAEIMAFSDKLVFSGGLSLFSPSTKMIRPGGFTMIPSDKGGARMAYKFIMGGVVPPAWNSDTFVCADGPDNPAICYDLPAIKSFIEMKSALKDVRVDPAGFGKTVSGRGLGGRYKSTPEETPARRWDISALGKSDTVSVALASNAAVFVSAIEQKDSQTPAWETLAIDSVDGRVLWRQTLPSEPVPGGLLIDRDGQVVVVLRDGSAICFGAPQEEI